MSKPFLYNTKLYEILDISGNGVFNTLDIILYWCYFVTVVFFYKTVVSKVIKKSSK